MGFWIIIVSLAALTGAVLARALLRRRQDGPPAAAHDLQVYRDQLKEIDRDLARGVLDPAEAERTRTEVSRRILAADASLRAEAVPGAGAGRGHAVAALLIVALLLAGSLLLYRQLGAPGYRDLPIEARLAASDQARAARLNQAEAETRAPARPPAPEASADFLDLMEKLRRAVAERPDDLRGLRLLVRNEAALGNLAAAHAAQEKVIATLGPEATADDHALLADLMIGAAGGYVSIEAETALRAALQRDPDQPVSRYYLGLYLLQVDRPDAAFRLWEGLLRDSPPDAPWVTSIRDRIEDVAWRAGVEYELPPAGSGPSAGDVAAAEGMSAAERDAMIRDMVARLSERLQREGGSPGEWARLIGAYGVLGDAERARAVWKAAREAFADDPAALDTLRRAAQAAEIGE